MTQADHGTRPLRVALIGCGWAGARHAGAWLGAGATLGWLIDADAGRAARLRDDLGARAAASRVGDDPRAALADPAIDAVDICLPHDLHAAVAIAAAEAGKQILVEKPLATSLDEADRMIAAAERAGIVLMVAENERFDPVRARVGDLLRDGAIGAPALVQIGRECYLRDSFLRDRPWFLDARAAAGGIMMSGGVHDFATLLALCGPVETVHALRAPQRFAEMEGDDTSVAVVRFRSGVVGTLVESFLMKSLATAAGPEVHTLRIDGTLGSLAVGADRRIRLYSERADFAAPGELRAHEVHIPEVDTFAIEIAHFIDAVARGVEPLTSGRAGRDALACVLAAYRSIETGLPAAP